MPKTRALTASMVRLLMEMGKLTWKVKCPTCNRWTTASDVQIAGEQPVKCRCGWTDKQDLRDLAPWCESDPA